MYMVSATRHASGQTPGQKSRSWLFNLRGFKATRDLSYHASMMVGNFRHCQNFSIIFGGAESLLMLPWPFFYEPLNNICISVSLQQKECFACDKIDIAHLYNVFPGVLFWIKCLQ
ncbi:hypothetical protein SAY87_017330 [Trapa incisa]|uniref:Uncharacterized protein n=1 Tax=Trapa incisa TaxID=236973 RepID=A0AAN7LAW9_9MYRT|nr:hypothetical protein SAY87_017330 [Trapa incisa]